MITTTLESYCDFDPVVIVRRSSARVKQPVVRAIVTHSHPEIQDAGLPGMILFVQNVRMFLRCPACGVLSFLALVGVGDCPKWKWNGREDRATLSPSIHHDVPECGWHGRLRNGVFEA